MKRYWYLLILVVGFLFSGTSLAATETTVFPLTTDGAWSVNSQPSAVYYNGKTYVAWVNAEKSLVVSSFDHSNGSYLEKVVATGYRGDFASPALLVRKNGQILLFSSKNEGEAHYTIWVSTNPEDISEWSAGKAGTAYGSGGTVPFAVGDDVYILYRSKNNVGVVYAAGLNASEDQSVVAELASSRIRGGIYSIGIPSGNDYTIKLDIPYIRACQDSEGAIHIVFTQLASGGANSTPKYYSYDKSSIHYVKFVGQSDAVNGLKYSMYKADGSSIGAISIGNPPDVIYSEATENRKAWAYDIALDENEQPVVLYATFDPDGKNQEYHCARWDGGESKWESSLITAAGDGLATTAYTANQSKFPTHALSAGGINFAGNDLSAVYLSKRAESGNFEIYKYATSNGGTTWEEAEAVTTGTPSGQVNIRPWKIQNAPANHDFSVLWMQGAYTNPTDYNTAIWVKGVSAGLSEIAFEKSEYEFVVGDKETLTVNFVPPFIEDKSIALVSDHPEIVEITADGKINCLALGDAVIRATAVADPSKTAVCTVHVVDKTVFHLFAERIQADALVEKMSTVAGLDQSVASYLQSLQANGSFPDVEYSSTARTDWAPLKHLDRMIAMALAYTHEESVYFEDADLKAKIEKALEYWQNIKPTSGNWYQNEIAEPQRMGIMLLLMEYYGLEKIDRDLFDISVNRMRDKGGDPASQAGANRIDVALHWMYRACLTRDDALLRVAMDWIYSPVVYTTSSEGIQYDNSYTQHGRQLHIGSYGEVFMDGATRAAMYAVGTDYAMPEDRIAILSGMIRDAYLSVIRGEYISYNVVGRASTRPGNTKKTGYTKIIDRMKVLDPQGISDYEAAAERINGTQPAGYELTPKSTHYFKTDYTVHQRPEYTVDLRMVSTRTARNEYLKDNGEGIKQYFLSDGSTGIFVDGDEYYNIFPVWNWAKIPGVTCPEFTEIPQATSYIRQGESDVVGGVTDSTYNVSVYQYTDTYSNINSSANKAWFFFDKEIVCLGNSIKSTSVYKVNTTVNQTLLKGDVVVSSNGNATTLVKGAYQYDNDLDWVWQGKVAYYFPEKGKLDLSAQAQSGSWLDINTSYTQEGAVSKDVFSLSFDHGLKPENEKYAYIIVPGVDTPEEAAAYNMDHVEIIVNSDSLQAVYHRETGVFGIVFYRSCGFNKHGLIVEADGPCAVLVKNAGTSELTVEVADLKKTTSAIKLGIETSLLGERKLVQYQQTETAYLGKSEKFIVDTNSPEYPGRDVLIDRNDWTIVTSIEGPADATVGGDNPFNILDGDQTSSFLFVKPGKSYGGVSAPTDYIPSFTIDLKQAQEISFFVYRHRTTGNTQAMLRAKALSFSGKNDEDNEFTPIVENLSIATDVPEVKVDFPEVNYRYVKLEMTDWDNSSGSTVQVSEFDLGRKLLSEIGETNVTGVVPAGSSADNAWVVYPNPVQRGHVLHLKQAGILRDDVRIEVFDIAGNKCLETDQANVDTGRLNQGMYILRATGKNTGERFVVNFVIY